MKKKTLHTKELFFFIGRFMGLQKWTFFFIFFLSLVWSLDSTMWPYLIRLVIDTFTQYDTDRASVWGSLKWLLIWGFSLRVIVEFGFRARDFLQVRAFPKLEADIRMAMFDHIQHHSPKYFNEHFAGSLANKISDMITQVSSILHNIGVFFPALITSIASIIFFYKINALFATLLGIWIILHFAICLAFTKKCASYANSHGEARSTLAGKIVDSLTNNFTVNLFFRFRFEKQRISTYQKEEQHTNYKAWNYVTWMFTCLSGLFIVAATTINGFMINQWVKGSLSTGEVIQIFNTIWNVIMLLWFAGEVIPQFFQSVGIASQALSVMKDPQDIRDAPHATPLVVKKGEIIFDNVSFHYGEKQLFDNKSIHIHGGEKVGLVGYSGAGKSTFVNLILRFYPIEKGKILIDGQDIAHVTLQSLRSQVALIPQDSVLFHRSLEDNIRYGRVEATQKEVREIAKLAHCDEFIMKTPQGYNSLVGERGTKLSGGERQRIAIARAMLSKAPILILDEATSALDSVTEKYIQTSLEKLMHNRTTLVVAHRLSTLSQMDRILVFHQGKIIEEGSHDELIAQEGHYAYMWQMQAGGFLPQEIPLQ